jgi:hypothetical protein
MHDTNGSLAICMFELYAVTQAHKIQVQQFTLQAKP